MGPHCGLHPLFLSSRLVVYSLSSKSLKFFSAHIWTSSPATQGFPWCGLLSCTNVVPWRMASASLSLLTEMILSIYLMERMSIHVINNDVPVIITLWNGGWVPGMSKGFHWKLASQPMDWVVLPWLANPTTQPWAPTPSVTRHTDTQWKK